MSNNPGVIALRTLVEQFGELDKWEFDKKTLAKIADMASELAGKILADVESPKIIDVPKTLTRPCCRGKSCGNTRLHLDVETNPDGVTFYSYLRDSNDDLYSGPWHEKEMLEWVEESSRWEAEDEAARNQ
ncbi:hypothetical protein [Arthrobacter sp. A2-55]|uniref:hypothetical protein n=1 Tax=Arthrobacter sp. A2-55 TaxID=2897337 RepID=UPI0021CD838E|nr:hypothetical protein [Arthrobacter sp. A2-55]MCU6480498.1 hypothetical protein [Arthrobacter sp. A2-55]